MENKYVHNSQRLDAETKFKLIELVEKYPVLYEYVGRDRKAIKRRNDCWEKVSVEMSLPANICKQKFESIKEKFRQQLQVPEWRNGTKRTKLTDRLSFLRSFYIKSEEKNGQSKPNPKLKTVFKSMPAQRSIKMPNGLPSRNSSVLSTESKAEPTPLKSSTMLIETMTTNNSPLCRSMLEHEPIGDDLSKFFSSMEQTAKKFSAQIQVKVKRMISDVVYDAEEQWLSEQKAANLSIKKYR